jgi:hypothetical protein
MLCKEIEQSENSLEEVAAENRSRVSLVDYLRHDLTYRAQTLAELELPARAVLLVEEDTAWGMHAWVLVGG